MTHRMDATSQSATDSQRTPYAVDITPSPDPSTTAHAREPIMQLRVLVNPGVLEDQQEILKNYVTPESAARLDALLAGEADQADFFFPEESPNWATRFTRTADGIEIRRLDPDSRIPEENSVQLTRAEADAVRAQLRRSLDSVLRERDADES